MIWKSSKKKDDCPEKKGCALIYQIEEFPYRFQLFYTSENIYGRKHGIGSPNFTSSGLRK